MSRPLVNIPKKIRRYSFVLAAVVFVLLTSCPVKRSIRSLVDLPVHTEQGIAKGNYGLPGNGDRCTSGRFWLRL